MESKFDKRKLKSINEDHRTTRPNRVRRVIPIQKTLFKMFLVATITRQALAQYEQPQIFNRYGSSHLMAPGGYEGGGGQHGAVGGYEQAGEYQAEERPRVHLGIRLRIPAFRFELPRFNLPKITVNAKIRQPDRPRVITLPEFNLDTSSKVAPPGLEGGKPQVGYNGGGEGYGGYSSSSQSHANYQSKPQEGVRENEFTFSTSGVNSDHRNNGHTSTGGYTNDYHYNRQQPHQQRYNNQANYGNVMAQAYSRPQQQPAYHMQPKLHKNYERPGFTQQSSYPMIRASQQSSTRVPPIQNENVNPYIGFDDDRRK